MRSKIASLSQDCFLIACRTAALALTLLAGSIHLSAAVIQEGPITVATTTQLNNMSISVLDAPFSTYPSAGTNVWYHSENWGDNFQKFTGTLAAPCGTLTWEKSEAQLFTNASSIDGKVWIVNTYNHASGILAFLHVEFAGSNLNKGRIALAWSTDDGDTFTYLGNIISPYGDPDQANGFMQGCPYLVKDGYFYTFFEETSARAVARASVTDVINAAISGTTSSWKKYYNGAWNESGLGGNYTSIAPAGIVHTGAGYSTYNQKCYLVTTRMAWSGGNAYLKLWESTDAVNWTLAQTLIDRPPAQVGANTGYQYAPVVNSDGTANGIIGKNFYVYCGYRPYETDKVFLRWSIDLGPGGNASNLALGETYSSSSNYDAGQSAANAFDGSTGTNWQAASGTYNGEWLEVDFGTSTTFNRCLISEYGYRTTGFRIEYWNGSSWATAYTGSALGSNAGPSTHTFPAVTATRARLYYTGGYQQPIVYEFRVYHDAANLALGKTYSSSSNWDANQTPPKAFDAALNTNWQAAWGNFSGQWLEVDFGGNTTFNQCVLSEYGSRTTGFRIEYWNGSSWQTAYTGTSIGSTSSPSTHSFTAVTGSRARIYYTSGTDQPIVYEFAVLNQ